MNNSQFNMRRDCVNYESRTYKTGEIVRKCKIDEAPNAPFECPNDCVFYKKRKYLGTWDYGSFTDELTLKEDSVKTEKKPQNNFDTSQSSKDILAELEQIVKEVGPSVIQDVKYSKLPWYKKIFKRRK